MPKYINADEMLEDEGAAYKAAQQKVRSGQNRRVNSMVHIKLQQLLYDAPAADVQEVKRGHWEISKLALVINDYYKCSECGTVWSRTFHYCPSCGAKMED